MILWVEFPRWKEEKIGGNREEKGENGKNKKFSMIFILIYKLRVKRIEIIKTAKQKDKNIKIDQSTREDLR